MRYTPYSESEIQSMHVLPDGIYVFKVIDVITIGKNGAPLIDKNGNDMANLKLLIWDSEQKERHIFTYISGDGAFAYKLRHFASSVGLITDYEQGIFNIHNTIGKSGEANIIVKKGTLKNDGSGELWPDRNDVKDFVVKVPGAPTALDPAIPNAVENLDDDIPF